MYPVSEAFQKAIKNNSRKYYWTGRIRTKEGKVLEFHQKDIVKGSGYITRQCCGSTEIELGTVYAAELGLSLFTELDRYSLRDAEITLSYHLQLEDQSFEEVPMGVFEVSEANRKVRSIDIKAYDYMLRFERKFNGFNMVGNAFEFISLCSRTCHVALAQDQTWYDSQPNGLEKLSIYPDNDIDTYRDVLFFVGQILGGFFLINREGKLELRTYQTDPVLEIERKHRFTSSFSDFITRYTAVSSTNLKTQFAEYYALEPDNALTMNLGVNPLLQFGLKKTREQIVRNILANLIAVEYVPFDSDTIGNPAIDLGDVLSFSGGQADSSQKSCVTANTIKIGGKQSLRCVGKNPKLSSTKSKNDKNISGLLNQIEAGRIGIHTFTNAAAYTVEETDVKIISIQFATSEENHAQFFGQVIVDVNADPIARSSMASGEVEILAENIIASVGSIAVDSEPGENLKLALELPVSWEESGLAEGTFTFELNDEKVTIHQPVESWHTGKHTILLYYPIEMIKADFTNTFNVYMRISGGTAFVDQGACIASISGQSMGASAAWDGVMELEERIGRFSFSNKFRFVSVSERIETRKYEELQLAITETLTGRLKIGGFTRPFIITEVIP